MIVRLGFLHTPRKFHIEVSRWKCKFDLLTHRNTASASFARGSSCGLASARSPSRSEHGAARKGYWPRAAAIPREHGAATTTGGSTARSQVE